MTAILEIFNIHRLKKMRRKNNDFTRSVLFIFDTFIDCKEFNLSSVPAIKIVSALNTN